MTYQCRIRYIYIYIYLIATEKVQNKDSKVEHYKKYWKKVSDSFDIHGFELGLEMEHEYKENYYYSGIAKTTLNNLDDLLKILEFKGGKICNFYEQKRLFSRY